MAEAAVATALSKLGELAMSEAKLLLQVGDDMVLLRDRLEWLQAFIRDADQRRRAGTDGLTRVWVRQTRDVAFLAEDALDEFFYEVDIQTPGYRGWKIWRKYFWTQIIIRPSLSTRMRKIKSRLEKISEHQKEYKIEHTPVVTWTSSTTETSARWKEDYKTVGFGKDVETLEKMLLRKDRPKKMFISILGESGVGKSTLAKDILKGEQVKREFAAFLFDMPADYNTESLLEDVYKRAKQEIIMEGDAVCEEGDIADKLRRLLEKKRYLMIIGGISSKTMLNCLMASLPDDDNGSRVMLILDAKNEGLAWYADSMNNKQQAGGTKGAVHLLGRLDEERSGQLFRSRVVRETQNEYMSIYERSIMFCWRFFSREEEQPNQEGGYLRKYQKIIYEITGGYPLAIVVLAGQLRFKEMPGQWEAVLQQLRTAGTEEAQGINVLYKEMEWQMSSPTLEANHLSTTRTTIERVFWASFEDLPNDLKLCFLYFAAFPKNSAQIASEIVWMWMSEGFIKPHKGKTVEEVGHNYLKELVLRCLVQIVRRDDAGDIASVRVHGSLHGFLHSEARESGFIEAHDMHNAFVPPSARRLSFMSFQGGPFKKKKKVSKADIPHCSPAVSSLSCVRSYAWSANKRTGTAN